MAWPISNYWDGLDGKWSTWNITVGIPSQSFRVLASTNISELTLPFASAYLTDPQALVCGSSRGVRHSYGYSPNGSQYWDARGGSDMMYNFIDVEEEFAKIPQPSSLWPDLGTKLTGLYTPAEEDHGWPSNHPGLVSGWRSKVEEADPNEGAFLGAIGLKAIPSRHWMWPTGRHYYWSWDNIQRSMIQRLTGDTELTMGYAYTPGAHYRNTHGSLSMGYYNPSLLTLDARSFPFSPPDDSLNLTILSISVSQSLHTRSKYSLLASPLYSTILDSTSPFLILPEIICRRFQHSFGLQYEASSGLFLVNSSNHLRLKEMNPSFTFELAGPEHKKNTENENDRGGDTLKITLPYESFDLFIKRSWDDDEPRAYFPIKIAKPGADNVLGRSFLQEVYLIVNYSFFNFTVSQVALSSPQNPSPQIQKLEKIPFGLDSTGVGIFDKIVLGALVLFVFGILYLGKPFLALFVPMVVVFVVFYVPRWAKLWVRERKVERLWKERHFKTLEENESNDIVAL